jgi:hypothetical protein
MNTFDKSQYKNFLDYAKFKVDNNSIKIQDINEDKFNQINAKCLNKNLIQDHSVQYLSSYFFIQFVIFHVFIMFYALKT